MGIFDKLFKSKEEKSFEKALNDISIAKKISPKAKPKRSSILRVIAFVQARSGNIGHAVEIAQEIKEKDILSEVLEVIGESIEALIEAQASIE